MQFDLSNLESCTMHSSGQNSATMLLRSSSCFSVPGWIQEARLSTQYHGINCPVLMKVPFWGSGGEISSYHGESTFFLECVRGEGTKDQPVVSDKIVGIRIPYCLIIRLIER